MKLSKHIILFQLVIFTVSSNLHAQGLSINAFRLLNYQVIKSINAYENTIDLTNPEQFDEFKALFVSENSLISNDIIPDNNFNTQITVNEYINLIKKYYSKGMLIQIRTENIGHPQMLNETEGLIDCQLTKFVIQSKTKCDINYQDTFFMVITYRFTFDDYNNVKDIKISDIKSSKSKGKFFTLKALQSFLGRKKSLSNGVLEINKQYYNLNENGELQLKNISPNSALAITHTDNNLLSTLFINNVGEYLSKNNASICDKNLIEVKFRKSHFLIETGLSYVLNSPTKHSFENLSFSNNNSNIFHLRIGYKFHITPKGKWVIKTGIAIENYSYSVNLNRNIVSNQSTDPDKSNYQRTNLITDINEKEELQYLTIPICLEKQLILHHDYILSLGTSFAIVQNLNASYSSNANGVYSGYYPQFFGININQNGVYDFGTYKLQTSDKLNPNQTIYAIDLSLGVRKLITKRWLWFAGISQRFGLSDIFENRKQYLSADSNRINSVTNVYPEFKFNYTTLDFGMNFNF